MPEYITIDKTKNGIPVPNEENSSAIDGQMLDCVDNIFKEYGLYGKVINYMPNSTIPRAGLYVVASINKNLPEADNLYDLSQRSEKSPNTFFIDTYVRKIENNDVFSVLMELINYCKCVEFLNYMYQINKLPLPDTLSIFELKGLLENESNTHNDNFTDDIIKAYASNVKHFFKIQKKHSHIKFLKKWDNFYRNGNYNFNEGKIKNFFHFLKRNQQKCSFKYLLETSGEINTMILSEEEYKSFKLHLKYEHPEIKYSVLHTEKFNDGVIKTPKGQEKNLELNPWGTSVTSLEYNEKLYNSLITDTPIEPMYVSKCKHYRIAFRQLDTDAITNICNKKKLSYIKHSDYGELVERGTVLSTKIPYDTMMHFASLAKCNCVKYTIDEGYYFSSKHNQITVLFNAFDFDKVQDIKCTLFSNAVKFSHTSAVVENNVSLTQQINKAKDTVKKQQINYLEIQEVAPYEL